MAKKYTNDVRFWLLAIIIFGGGFALNPSVGLSILDFPSLRVGLYQIVAVSLLLFSLPLLLKKRQELLKNRWLIGGFLAIFIAISVGIFFAEARLRTALYSLSLLFLLTVGLSAGLIYSELSKSEKRKLINVGLWSGLVFGILAIIQLIVATFEPTGFGTLCAGCKADVFGFPRINLFAAEPQFFANSLLPAFFLALFQSKSRLAKFSLFFTTLAISLTFSRGGFLAIFIAITALFIIAFVKRIDTSFIRKKLPIIFTGLLFGFILLFSSANIRYANTPFIAHNTFVSMVDQLSLGKIKIPQKSVAKTRRKRSTKQQFFPTCRFR